MTMQVPTGPEQSSPVVRAGGFRQWFVDIVTTLAAWRDLLLPPGADGVYSPPPAPVTLAGNWSSVGGSLPPFRVTRRGHYVMFEGALALTGSTVNPGTLLGTFDPDYAPPQDVLLSLQSTGSRMVRVKPDGEIRIDGTSGVAVNAYFVIPGGWWAK